MILVVEFPALQDEINSIYSKWEAFKKGHKNKIAKKYVEDFVNFLCSSMNVSTLYNFLVFEVCITYFSLGVSKWACSKKENLEYVSYLKYPRQNFHNQNDINVYVSLNSR